jgi:hypothetical protein
MPAQLKFVKRQAAVPSNRRKLTVDCTLPIYAFVTGELALPREPPKRLVYAVRHTYVQAGQGQIPVDRRGLAAARLRLWACAAVAVVLALLPAADASAQQTCFGKGSVLTCLDRSGGPAYLATCFGSKQYRTCTSPSGQFTLSETPTNSSSASTTGALQVDSGSSSAAPGADPAFGVKPSSTTNPAFAR